MGKEKFIRGSKKDDVEVEVLANEIIDFTNGKKLHGQFKAAALALATMNTFKQAGASKEYLFEFINLNWNIFHTINENEM